MSDTLNLANSIWPNGMKVDSAGRAVYYPLGTKKKYVPTSSAQWPKGNKLVSPYVYDKDDKLVGFVDTKALTVSKNTAIYLPYEHIEAEFSAINKGKLQIHAPNAITKKASWKDSEVEDITEAQFKYKGCENVTAMKNIQYDLLADIANGLWSKPLWDLTDGSYMFSHCEIITSFSSELPSLTDGCSMFAYSELSSFSSELPNLTNGSYMFACSKLTSFNSDLSSLTNGENMFFNCRILSTFNADLSSLTNGYSMFSGCYLNTASVQNIADTINTYNGTIHIDIKNYTPNAEETTAFETIASKGWTVYVMGYSGNEYQWNPTSLTPLDGEEQQTPIPYWAKPVPSDEQNARYVDSEGNFYNILGGNFIYGDNLETYGMFTCEEDAAANMRLTKIENLTKIVK